MNSKVFLISAKEILTNLLTFPWPSSIKIPPLLPVPMGLMFGVAGGSGRVSNDGLFLAKEASKHSCVITLDAITTFKAL